MPSVAVAVIVALPGAFASISPLITDTASGLLEVQATALLVAFSGSTSAVRVTFWPISIACGTPVITMLSTGITNGCTRICTRSDTAGSSAAVARISAFPSALASILPSLSIEMISG